MSEETKRKLNQAITITEEGKPHRINIPQLKIALLDLANDVNALEDYLINAVRVIEEKIAALAK